LVLQRISTTLLNHTRTSDVVVRWGGDEFLIIAPFTDKENALSMLKRIEAGLQQVSNTMEMGVTASIGLSVYPDQAENLDDLIKMADRKMYKYKYKAKLHNGI
jgi:diguanylate cyclase (GGDEF)-like protein